uniref:Phospholipase A2 group XIIA n=1 Tax=Catharus ustulatus TaxID=91951 RepID=A0A8C3TNR4_CATUS
MKTGSVGEGGEGVKVELCMTPRWLLLRDWFGIPSALTCGEFDMWFFHCSFWDIFVSLYSSIKLSLSQPITLVLIFNCYSLSIGYIFLILEYQWRVCVFSSQFDIGIPSMTRCCNHHDRCYDTCGNKKNDCDEQFQTCLSKICRDVQKTLGISESVQACESTVQLLFDAVIHLGCKPYLDSQRAACMCRYEDKTDL